MVLPTGDLLKLIALDNERRRAILLQWFTIVANDRSVVSAAPDDEISISRDGGRLIAKGSELCKRDALQVTNTCLLRHSVAIFDTQSKLAEMLRAPRIDPEVFRISIVLSNLKLYLRESWLLFHHPRVQ